MTLGLYWKKVGDKFAENIVIRQTICDIYRFVDVKQKAGLDSLGLNLLAVYAQRKSNTPLLNL